jgi:hypothetical protein
MIFDIIDLEALLAILIKHLTNEIDEFGRDGGENFFREGDLLELNLITNLLLIRAIKGEIPNHNAI